MSEIRAILTLGISRKCYHQTYRYVLANNFADNKERQARQVRGISSLR